MRGHEAAPPSSLILSLNVGVFNLMGQQATAGDAMDQSVLMLGTDDC